MQNNEAANFLDKKCKILPVWLTMLLKKSKCKALTRNYNAERVVGNNYGIHRV